MIRLTKQQVILLHRDVIAQSGGSPEIRDEGLLESALNAPFQTFAGTELYPTIIDKAAQLGYSLIKNHAFVDGNKRIGTHVMLVFLMLNGIDVDYEDEELTRLILGVAAGEISSEQLLAWLQAHIC
jgi:death on curing protein